VNWNNNAARIRREVLVRTARLALEGSLAEGADGIAYDMTGPGWEVVRCCVHHDRAIIRLRAMAALGFAPQGLADADRPLAEYARAAIARAEGLRAAPRGKAEDGGAEGSVLSVNDEACNACVKTRHRVTEGCQGCLARPCKMNCPKGAVSFREGRAWIDPDKCVDCGLCARNCPYSAIIKQSVPCEESCPTGALAKDDEGRERIDPERCIECGKCLKACPFGAVAESSRIVDAALALKSGRRVVALLAPALAVQFPGGFARLVAALRELGFARVEEAARGADVTARLEAVELAERLARKAEGGFMATSCCPAWKRASRLAGPGVASRVSATPSPMALGAAQLAREEPESLVVFVSPCVAKRREAAADPNVYLALTAEELGALLVAAGLDVAAAEPDQAGAEERPSAEGRLFAVSGGVAEAVKAASRAAGAPEPQTVAVNGLTKQSLKEISLWESSPPEADLVEVMACEGGCVGGPCALANPKAAAAQLALFAKKI